MRSPEAPDLILREFGRALALLAMTPTAGKVYAAKTSAEFRRLLLRRSGFHVYYVVDVGARVVVIAAIWNGARGAAFNADRSADESRPKSGAADCGTSSRSSKNRRRSRCQCLDPSTALGDS